METVSIPVLQELKLDLLPVSGIAILMVHDMYLEYAWKNGYGQVLQDLFDNSGDETFYELIEVYKHCEQLAYIAQDIVA